MNFKKGLISLILMSSLVSCSNEATVEPNTENEQGDIVQEGVESEPSEADKEDINNTPNVIIDRDGSELIIPEEVKSIVSLAPSITETLIDFGLGDKIVGVDTYSLDIEGVDPNMQSFEIMSPDIELLATLQPDIIFVSGMSKGGYDDPLKPIKDLGLTVTYIPTSNTFEDIEKDILFIGIVTKEEEKAEKIVGEFQKDIEEIKAKIDGVFLENNTVYFEISPSPYLYSFGKGVFLDDVLDMLHLENIFSDQDNWISITEEEILNRNPDFIFTNTYIDDAIMEIKNREGWDTLEAVKNDNVYKIDQDSSSHSNEYVIKSIKEMAKAVYPDIFE